MLSEEARMAQPDLKRKIVLLGDSAVGKTSLIRRFVTDSFDDSYITTIGTKITKKDVRASNGLAVTMMIWDVLGQQGYTGTQAMSYVGTQGAIFVFDLTRPESLASIEKYWRPELAKVVGDVPCLLVGNKLDLAGQRGVGDSDVAKAASALGARHFLSSAKTGEGVEPLFAKMAEMVAGACDAPPAPGGPASARAVSTLTDVTDMVILDFTQSFGDQELAMAMVRKQFAKAGLDISHPTRAALLEAVRLLAEAEQGFKSPDEIQANLLRRRAIVEKCQ
jgi:small GTP-binding protein